MQAIYFPFHYLSIFTLKVEAIVMAGSGGDDLKFCANCKREIAAVNFVMHEVHCRRNIVLCTICDEPVARSEMDEHMVEEHTHCPECNKQVNLDLAHAILENN